MRSVPAHVRDQPRTVAAFLAVVAYTLVIATFLDLVPYYPEIDLRTSTILSHAIATTNAATIVCLVLGWYFIRDGRVRAHRAAMLTAFSLILLFLVLYLVRVGGGGTKQFVGPDIVTVGYLSMLAVHILLSILAVPLVLYVLLLGLTHTPAELRNTSHARVGRLAVGTWLISLVLGLVTYLMLEHLFGWEYVAAVGPLLG